MQLQSCHLPKFAATLVLSMAVALTACSKKSDDENTNANAASAAEATAAPMSAAPADDQGNAAVVNENTAALDAGPDVAASVSADTGMASGTADTNTEALEGAVDNSGMDKISENDQVIDNEPASPNAPRADDDATGNVGNARVGQ